MQVKKNILFVKEKGLVVDMFAIYS